jgi:hypothetical protein
MFRANPSGVCSVHAITGATLQRSCEKQATSLG